MFDVCFSSENMAAERSGMQDGFYGFDVIVRHVHCDVVCIAVSIRYRVMGNPAYDIVSSAVSHLLNLVCVTQSHSLFPDYAGIFYI